MFKDWDSITPGPPHRVTIIQHICSKTRQRRKYINIKESTHCEMGSVRHNAIWRTVRTAHLSVLMAAQLSVHNTAQNGSDNLPSYLQTTIIAQILSIGGKGGVKCWEICQHSTRHSYNRRVD